MRENSTYWEIKPSAVKGNDMEQSDQESGYACVAVSGRIARGKPTVTDFTYDTLNHGRGDQPQYNTLQRFEAGNPLSSGNGYNTVKWKSNICEDTMADYDTLQKDSKL